MYERIKDCLKKADVAYSVIEHQPVYNSAEVQELGTDAEAESKSLALLVDGNIVVLTLPIADKVDKAVLKNLGYSGRFSFLKPEVISEELGVEMGAVPPFGFKSEVKCLVSSKFLNHEYFYISPGLHDITLQMGAAKLKRLQQLGLLTLI
jgi:prolyl-tRNA editing enzyme YbaK/EbsC (Cys-tRNA(Pro) deacylase)